MPQTSQDQLEHLQNLASLGQLSRAVAHDLNNYLHVILGNARLALIELRSDSPVAYRVRSIELVASQAAELARQILEYSREAPATMAPVDLNRLVAEARLLVKGLDSSGLSIHYCLGEVLPVLMGDVVRLRQLVMNLLWNAVEAIGDCPGRIEVETGTDDAGAVVLSVSDNGKGMNEEVQRRMFEPGFSTKGSSRGLGLSTALAVLKDHVGEVEVSSRPDAGSRVTVRFFRAESGRWDSRGD